MRGHLTNTKYWDSHWRRITLPVQNGFKTNWDLGSIICRGFYRNLPLNTLRSVMEIGGAPGGYLAFFAHKFKLKVHALDYSPVGCDMTKENFNRLGLSVTVHQEDLFQIDGRLPCFDLVYSLGFVEHFSDPVKVIAAHWNLVNPGGYLVIGVPHFVRVYWHILSCLAPEVTAGHNRQTLDPADWRKIELSNGMQVIRKEYLGGFDPFLIAAILNEQSLLHPEKSNWTLSGLSRILILFRRFRNYVYRRLPFISRLQTINNPLFSSYAMAYYHKPENTHVVGK